MGLALRRERSSGRLPVRPRQPRAVDPVFAAQPSLIVVNALLLNRLRASRDFRPPLQARGRQLLVAHRSLSACARSSDARRRWPPPTSRCSSAARLAIRRKEMLAQEDPSLQQPGSAALVPINCGALPEGLLESELFGHVRGAFTGVVATCIGRFRGRRAAAPSSSIVQEVGDMPMALQIKILRALQEYTVVKVGDSRLGDGRPVRDRGHSLGAGGRRQGPGVSARTSTIASTS